MQIVAIRGAITLENNTKEEIELNTIELINTILENNKISKDDIIQAIFTVTKDIDADFPAKYARLNLGWDNVPMICSYEMSVPNSLQMCLRVLITTYSEFSKNEVKHAYLKGAAKLRPDLSK